MITADGLAKSFGEIQAVKEVSFTAKNGEATDYSDPMAQENLPRCASYMVC